MSEITILHLSELQFKKDLAENDMIFRQTVRREFLASIETHIETFAPPDVVAVTGDIAYSGKKQEYEEASIFFNELKAILPAHTEFLAVPGNHDVERAQIKKLLSLHDIVSNNEVDSFLNDDGYIKNFVLPKFKNFKEFARQLNPGLYGSPHDYFWTETTGAGGEKTAFLGLNSAWASENDQDPSNIALGLPQWKKALEKTMDTPNRILLMHHPPSMLEEKDFKSFNEEIYKTYGVILHGHLHPDSPGSPLAGADARHIIAANTAYTHGGYTGFQVLRIKFKADGISIRIWPYRLDTRKQPVFLPDTERWHGQSGKVYFYLNFTPPGNREDLPSPGSPRVPRRYREWVLHRFSNIAVEKSGAKDVPPGIPLTDIYIPVKTANPFYRSGDEGNGEADGEPPEIDTVELLGRRKIVLLRGEAGTGKTTLIKYLAYRIVTGTAPGEFHGFLPVVVFLEDLSGLYEKEMAAPPGELTFESLLDKYFRQHDGNLSLTAVHGFLSAGKALFLLDGTDEVPDRLRRGLLELISDFYRRYKTNRFLITGRAHGMGTDLPECFREYCRDIEPVAAGSARDFSGRWFGVMDAGDGKAAKPAGQLKEDIENNRDLEAFTRNPLFLTALCMLYLDNKRLPEQRAALFSHLLENLMDRRFGTDEYVEKVENFLQALAFAMQLENQGGISPGEVKELLKRMFPQEDGSPAHYRRKIDGLFAALQWKSGFLEHRDGQLRFRRRWSREFLAARYMYGLDMDVYPFIEKPGWEETILLHTALVNMTCKKKADQMVKQVLTYPHKEPAVQRRILLLGARAFRDIPPGEREAETAALARKTLLKFTRSHADAAPGERFAAGELLGNIGDPRIDIQAPPMVLVEEGMFPMGTWETEKEKPVRHVHLDSYMIGKYPVTNTEFTAFVRDGGYETEAYWPPEGLEWLKTNNIRGPQFLHRSKWNRPNFPVVGIGWYEAEAYCRWLSAKTGVRYTLPTEAQWEKAARGTGELMFPWGNRFDAAGCNAGAMGWERTSPIGIFPDGVSPYGCTDMAGNIAEWCADWYAADYYNSAPAENPGGPGAGTYRVYRGGGWDANIYRCRTTARDSLTPGTRSNRLGFRIVRAFVPPRFPLGIKSFPSIIKENFLYIDKTEYIYKLLKRGGLYYFLSRPRRFGKSLLVSTLKQIFLGEQELFKGLWIYDKLSWEKYPVIHIDFLGFNYGNKEELIHTINYILGRNAAEYGITLAEKSFDTRFDELIRELSKQNPVVILIDEYDKPIIEHLENYGIARENRGVLKTFYEAVKRAEDHLKFVFITGVSRFSKVSIFSGLNNLNDLTISDEFSTMLGYTEPEMKRHFLPCFDVLAGRLGRDRAGIAAQVKDRYNGYSWDGENFVYNPVSIMKLFDMKLFENYWFSLGTPHFLVRFLLKKSRDLREYETGVRASGFLFEQFDIDNINPDSLLFQTGYLTIKKRIVPPSGKPEYILSYPNTEVRESFITHFFDAYTRNDIAVVDSFLLELRETLMKGRLERFFEMLKGYLATIPSNLVYNKDLESYYHLVIYMLLGVTGMDISPECITNRGRIDAAIETPDRVYVMEFKIGPSSRAMKQIKVKKYYEKFLLTAKQIMLVGVGFDTNERNIRDYVIKEWKRKPAQRKSN